MKLLYTTLATSLLITSCVPQLNYLGSSGTPTQNVDVYVDADAIKKPYKIMGKGYPLNGIGSDVNLQLLQQKAIALAKQKGADAILFQDYYITNGVKVFTGSKKEGEKATQDTRTAYVSSELQSYRDVLFLKYE